VTLRVAAVYSAAAAVAAAAQAAAQKRLQTPALAEPTRLQRQQQKKM
jgi:hypothetical protein